MNLTTQALLTFNEFKSKFGSLQPKTLDDMLRLCVFSCSNCGSDNYWCSLLGVDLLGSSGFSNELFCFKVTTIGAGDVSGYFVGLLYHIANDRLLLTNVSFFCNNCKFYKKYSLTAIASKVIYDIKLL